MPTPLPPYCSIRSLVPCKYRKTRWHCCQWTRPGLELNRLRAPTAYAMSGRVPTDRYMRLPTALRYGTEDIYAISSGESGQSSLERVTDLSRGVETGRQLDMLCFSRTSSMCLACERYIRCLEQSRITWMPKI